MLTIIYGPLHYRWADPSWDTSTQSSIYLGLLAIACYYMLLYRGEVCRCTKNITGILSEVYAQGRVYMSL